MDKKIGEIYRNEKTGEEYIIRESGKKIFWDISEYDYTSHSDAHLRSIYKCPFCGMETYSTQNVRDLKKRCLKDNSTMIYCGHCGHQNVVDD